VLPQPVTPVEPIEPSDARILPLDALDRRAEAIRALRHTGALVVQVVVLAGLLSLFFLRVPQVDGHSMAPQIDAGDHVVINTVAYALRIDRPGSDTPIVDVHLRPVQRADVVAFVYGAGDDARIYLKRVVGLPGESIAIERGVVSVDGVTLAESYGPHLDTTDMKAVVVPAGCLFVLGDNRGDSDDSRSLGPIPESAVIGRAAVVAWPPDRARAIR
jgi:signal peptidase I